MYVLLVCPQRLERKYQGHIEDKHKDSSHSEVAISFSPLYRMTNDFPA